MDYVIVVNDNGELKTVSATELDAWVEGRNTAYLSNDLDKVINAILDKRSAEGETRS